MFGDRCLGMSGCGHSTNWTCPCTCGEEYERKSNYRTEPTPKPQATIKDLERYLHHEESCQANDLDPLDHAPCTCGLRVFFNPWNRKDQTNG